MSGLVLAPIIAIAVLFGAALLLAAQKGRQRQLMGRIVAGGAAARGTPSILFFTADTCSICHTAQKPALESMAASLDGVDVREIDVVEHPDIARAYRVMTLPTTVMLDAGGRVTHINVGFAPAQRLRAQLAGMGVPAAA